jgi:hypothetical protein
VIPDEQRLVLAFRQRGIRQIVLDPVDLGFRVEERLKGERGLGGERPPVVLEAVLRQVPDGQIRRPDDRAAVGLVEPREHPEQRGFAGTIRPGQTHALAVGDLPGHVVEQDAFAEGLGEGLELNQTTSEVILRKP